MQDWRFLKYEDSRQFESNISDPIDQAFVKWAINRAILRPSVFGDSPNEPFDMLYFANVMLEISKKRHIAQLIFEGRLDEIW